MSPQPAASRTLLNTPRQPVFWAVSLGHMTNDLFMSMGPVLLVFLSATIMPISTAQIGLAVSARELTGALSQPLFGWVSDRTGGRWLGAGGVTWVIGWLMVSLIVALSGRFWLMLIPFAISALGSGAFHPVGAMVAAETDQAQEASNTAYFFLFGQSGLAIGPALAGFLLDRGDATRALFGPSANPLAPIFALSAFAIPGVLAMFLTIPPNRESSAPVQSPIPADEAPATARLPQVALGPLLLVAAIVLLQSVVRSASANFFPVLFERKGWSPTQYGLITSSFWISSAVAGVIFGRLADRYDRRRIIALTLLFAAPSLFLLPLSDGPLAFGLAIITGGLLGGSFSIFVVLAQHIIPASRAFASGTMLGFSFMSGALGSLLVGVLADGPGALFGAQAATSGGLGVETTYQIMAAIVVAAGLLAFALPKWMAGTSSSAS